MNNAVPSHPNLQDLARVSMREHGFDPDFSPAVNAQVAALTSHPPAARRRTDVRDLRARLWSSIDNDTSRDLDQVEVAEALPNGDVKVLVAIADVDAFVPAASPIDDHAAQATTTVYTGVQNFSDAARGAFDRADVAAPGRRSAQRGHRDRGGAERRGAEAVMSTGRSFAIARN